MNARHWDAIYTSKGEQAVSWFETFPAVSLRMLEAAGLTSESCVIDVGSGAARLMDALVARGLDCLVALDVSDAALQRVRARCVARLRQTLKPGGSAVIATFARDGPERCSGLPVVRYSPESLAAELGPDFRLEESIAHTHVTPTGARQSFQYSRFTRVADVSQAPTAAA